MRFFFFLGSYIALASYGMSQMPPHFSAPSMSPLFSQPLSVLSAMPYLAQYCAGLMSLSVQDDARVVLALMEEVGDDDVFPLLEVEGYVAFH